ncbi:Senescence-specific cysteine protease SAG39 [Linum grandiflorum]
MSENRPPTSVMAGFQKMRSSSSQETKALRQNATTLTRTLPGDRAMLMQPKRRNYTGESKVFSGRIKGFEEVPANDEGALLKVVDKQPVSVLVHIKGKLFETYSGGIMSGEYCGTDGHAATVVGYGESEEKKYWLLKNSWGHGWGEDDYFRMKRDVAAKEGLCGIARYACYPTPTEFSEVPFLQAAAHDHLHTRNDKYERSLLLSGCFRKI